MSKNQRFQLQSYGIYGFHDNYDDFVKFMCAPMDRNPFDLLIDPNSIDEKLIVLDKLIDLPGKMYVPVERFIPGNKNQKFDVIETTGCPIIFEPDPNASLDFSDESLDEIEESTMILTESSVSDDDFDDESDNINEDDFNVDIIIESNGTDYDLDLNVRP